ncbi:MAG: efflux RND transporter periplasmic adaptor subunit [Candidatus Hydrogenedentes bacterium]|nr:efflux RND transporter periplasmic adaptor subunit [Candidatus Hydrogenedentota bacterium]
MTNPNSTKMPDVAQTLGIGGGRSRVHHYGRWLMVVLLLAGAGAAGRYWLTQNKSDGVRYETQKVSRGDLRVTVTATGTLEPIKTVDVGIEVSGTVKTVEVDYNEQVKVGQVLARLDTSKLEAQALQSEAALNSARAKLLQAQASVEEAEAQMARLDEVKKLSDGKLPSKYDYDTQKAAQSRAHADESSAKAAVEQAQATLDANRSDLAKAVVHSPIDGVVLDRLVEPGQTVAAQFQSPTLFTLAEDLTQMELQIDVDEADVGKVKEDQEAAFTVDAFPDQEFPARTTQVRYASETVEGVVTYKTILRVDNSSLTLRPGMTATAVVTVDSRNNALLVPNTALRFSPPTTETEEESGGSILSKILPHPPRREATPRVDASVNAKEQQVWILRDGQLTPVLITKGLSNGVLTEVVGGGLTDGMDLVTDMVTASS